VKEFCAKDGSIMDIDPTEKYIRLLKNTGWNPKLSMEQNRPTIRSCPNRRAPIPRQVVTQAINIISQVLATIYALLVDIKVSYDGEQLRLVCRELFDYGNMVDSCISKEYLHVQFNSLQALYAMGMKETDRARLVQHGCQAMYKNEQSKCFMIELIAY
jgi:hypothetical protein